MAKSSMLVNITSDNKLASETTDNFSITFGPNIPINGNFGMALESLSLWYSWYNISSDYNNTQLRYYNGSAWKNVSITPGLYGVTDINTYLQNQMLANGDFTTGAGGNIFYISLTPDYNTFKLQVTVSNSYQLDLSIGNLYLLLGFNPIIVTSTQQGTNNINISNGVDRVLVHLDCITGSWLGSSSSDVLYSFSPDGSPSSLLQIKPYRLIYLPMNRSGYLNSLRVYITDQQGRRLNLNGETVSLQLALRKLG